MNRLSTKHLVLFILGVTIISSKSYSSIFIDIGGRDTWIASILASFIFIGFVLLLCNIIIKRDSFDIIEISNKLFPKWISNIFIFLLAFSLLILSLESAAVEASIVHTGLFIYTPVWFIIFLFILPSFFLLAKDLKTILIFILVASGLWIFGLGGLFILVEKYKNFDYILPVLGDGISKNFFVTTLMILGSLSSFTAILPYLKYIEDRRNLRKHTMIATIICTVIVSFSILGTISFFGPVRAANIFYPELIQSQRVEVYNFIEFGEFFFVIQTTLGFLIKYIICSYGIVLLLKDKIKNTNTFIFIYSLIIFILGTFLSRNNIILYDLLKLLQLVILSLLFVIPLITYLFYNIKFRKKV